MAPDVLDRLRAADPATRMPEPDPAERERLRRTILATPAKPRPKRRWRPTGRTLAVLLGGAVLLGSGTVYAARLVIGNQSETPRLATKNWTTTIAFKKDDALYTVDSDGTRLRLIAEHAGWGGVAWSPNGQQIAYGSGKGLYVVNADGSQRRKVADDHPGGGIAWSPDGSQLVFSTPGGYFAKLEIVNVDGTGRRELPGLVDREYGIGYDANPAWSPNGRIFFSSFGHPRSGMGEICSVNPDGSGLELVTATEGFNSNYSNFFSLSPDGRWLLFWQERSRRLVRLAANGHGAPALVLDKTPAGEGAGWSSWSPDGRWIVFTTADWPSRRGVYNGLYIVRSDGSGLRKVPNTKGGNFPAWQTQ
jgi:Tol biopolymer transport system component